MAFTSIDDMTSELAAGKGFRADFFKMTSSVAMVAGNAYDLAQGTGNPPNTNAYSGTALTATVPDDTLGWGIPHGGNVSTDTKQVLNAAMQAIGSNSAPGIAMLMDIALYYPGIDLKSTSLQTFTNTLSLTRHTDGKGLRAFLLVTTQSGNPTGTPRMSVFNYRDQDDNDAAYSGMTIDFLTGATNKPTVAHIVHAGPQANLPGLFLPLNAGDTGIKRVNSMQLSTAYGGATTLTGCMVLCKPILSVPLVAVGAPGERSFLFNVPAKTIIPDGACLSWLYLPGAAVAASSIFQGHLDLGWG